MRTTVDLPDDLHQLALSLSRDRRQSLSTVVADLMRRGLHAGQLTKDADSGIRNVDGFPVLYGGRPTTFDDVRALDDP